MTTICIPDGLKIQQPIKINVVQESVCPLISDLAPCLEATTTNNTKVKPEPATTNNDTSTSNKSPINNINNKSVRSNAKKRSKSSELRGGAIYRGCDCEKHNGLQDDCPRTGCQGSPDCVNLPAPVCQPSEFSNFKHLKTFDVSKKAKFRYDVFSVTNSPATTSYYIIN